MIMREISQVFYDNFLWVTYKNVIPRGVICINCIYKIEEETRYLSVL